MSYLAQSAKRVFVRSLRGLRSALWTAFAILAASFSGCGSLPDAQISYYQTKSQVTVKVTRTVLCDATKQPIVANTIAPSVAHSADFSKERSFGLAGLRGPFSDSDIKVDFYEDGRLKGFNAGQTGQGETVLKAVTALAATLAAFAADSDYTEQCDYVKEAGGGKPLTLTYEGPIDPSLADTQPIPPDAASAAYAQKLTSALGGICVVVKGTDAPMPPVLYQANEGDVLIAVRQPALLKLEVGMLIRGGCVQPLWQGRVPVAQLGLEYKLPIPRAAAFGKQTFSAAFAESGALTNVQYVSSSGAASALGATNSMAAMIQGDTTSAKVAAVRTEADLIAQQQRLIQCKADPKSCK